MPLTRSHIRATTEAYLARHPHERESLAGLLDAAGGALCVEGAGPWLASLPDAAWELVPPVRRAAAALDWHPEHGDRCQHLVFTSPGLDRAGIEQLLDSCLLTDAEYAAGPEGWQRLPAAFDSLLDAA